MLKQKQDQLLPSGWKMRNQVEESYKWFAGETIILPHFLNEGRIEDKIRTNAGLTQPFGREAKWKLCHGPV